MKKLFLNYYLFIILILLLAKFAAIPLVERFAGAPFKQEFNQYYRELVRGTFFVLGQDLQQFPQQQWKSRLQQLQPKFGYPIALVAINSDKFTTSERTQLVAGQIVVNNHYDQFWHRIGESGFALTMGPFHDRAVGRSLNLLVWALLLLFLGLTTATWAFPFWRKLTGISRAATAFGNGHFEIRIDIPRHSTLAPLANTFNQMAERIQQLINSQKELTNAVSHELRTPIARLRFGVEMVETSSIPAERARYVNGVHRDLDELDGLVSELLTYARFDRKTPDLQMQELAIVPWLEDVLADLTTEVSAHLQHFFMVDQNVKAHFEPKYLSRAVSNLVQNASRYGNGLVIVTLEHQDKEYLIHVDDDGPGIPEASREKVFEPFSRLDSSRSRESGGYGLGLAIVKRVVHSHHGSVTIAASPLGGSRFSIRWPSK